jgi:hypothetical protein
MAHGSFFWYQKKRESLWLVVGCKYTNQRFSLIILVPKKRTLVWHVGMDCVDNTKNNLEEQKYYI